ncbi:unnamed protein product [Adineta ricciae]|uniref:Hexosyltransferase n=1 Tax=Adineta ricciae TaxID=249248 RepID=A0A814ICF1_ADIRI|nr:unnamed protein product [Adineta ricciae]CAF1022538.1 unnamed protein product [Adineta ricciae]
MRRSRHNRIFLLLLTLLIFYIVWYVFNAIRRPSREPGEEQAYLHAVSGALPIIHNPKLCSKNKIDLILVIISSGTHFLERQAVRETWGSMTHAFNIHSQRLFVVGYQEGSNLYSDLLNEAEHEKDILYLTQNDNSMTMKELHAYRWLDKYCPNATFTFKTEDDLFVNSILLHELVSELNRQPEVSQNRSLYNISLGPLFQARSNSDVHTFLFGWAFESGKPQRNHSMGQYYVSYKEYSKELYPRYCSGFGYFMDSETRRLLVEEGFKERHPFRFSDIFITGILPEQLNFVCDILPFTYTQGTTEQCINNIKRNNLKDIKVSTPPLLVCSTGRHIAQNTFSDYYRIWTVLKYVYGDRMHGNKQNKE